MTLHDTPSYAQNMPSYAQMYSRRISRNSYNLITKMDYAQAIYYYYIAPTSFCFEYADLQYTAL